MKSFIDKYILSTITQPIAELESDFGSQVGIWSLNFLNPGVVVVSPTENEDFTCLVSITNSWSHT